VDYKDGGMPGVEKHNGTNREQSAGAAADAVTGSLAARPDLPYAYVAPQTVLQDVLLTVWTSILGIDKIGIEGDFFELGGDSVLATQIISRLRDMFRMDLPLIVLFDSPTIEKLAQFMIENEARPGLVEKTAALLKRIEGMTEEEVTRTLQSR
jgi:surfactin family lipopeptide synthetase C